MLKTDIDPAQQAAKYLSDTAGFDPLQVTAFVITAKMAPTSTAPAVSIVVPSTAAIFPNLQTAFGNAVANKRTTAQAVLTNLGITG